jgi:hypothetical protein
MVLPEVAAIGQIISALNGSMTFLSKLSNSRVQLGKSEINLAKEGVEKALSEAKDLIEMQYHKDFYIGLSIISVEIWERSDKLKELIDTYVLLKYDNNTLIETGVWCQMESKFKPIYEKSSEFVAINLNSINGLNPTDLANLKNLVNQFDIHYKNADLELKSKKDICMLKEHVDLMGKRSIDIHKLCNNNMKRLN